MPTLLRDEVTTYSAEPPMIAVPATWWERRPEIATQLRAEGRIILLRGDMVMVERRDPFETAHLLMGRTLDGGIMYGANLPTNG